MNKFDIALTLARVLTSGTIMSIEKNEKELLSLENLIKEYTNCSYVSLFNSVTGAIHAALWGQGIWHGGAVALDPGTEQERKFIRWLGIHIIEGRHGRPYQIVEIDPSSRPVFPGLQERGHGFRATILDFTPLGFGPCAGLATNEQVIWKRSERLKIFGSFDLRTMWTQQDSLPDLEVGVQFNYRLSPLVAACVRLHLLKQNDITRSVNSHDH